MQAYHNFVIGDHRIVNCQSRNRGYRMRMENLNVSQFFVMVHEATFVHYYRASKLLGRRRHVVISRGTMTPIGEYREVHSLRDARAIAKELGAYFLMP